MDLDELRVTLAAQLIAKFGFGVADPPIKLLELEPADGLACSELSTNSALALAETLGTAQRALLHEGVDGGYVEVWMCNGRDTEFQGGVVVRGVTRPFLTLATEGDQWWLDCLLVDVESEDPDPEAYDDEYDCYTYWLLKPAQDVSDDVRDPTMSYTDNARFAAPAVMIAAQELRSPQSFGAVDLTLMLMAANPETPIEVLRQLAVDPMEEVRRCVAANPAVTDEVKALASLAADPG